MTSLLLKPASYFKASSGISVLHVTSRCVRNVCTTMFHPAQTSPVSTSTHSKSRPLQLLKSQPKTYSKGLPSYSNTSGTRGRSCRENVPFQQCTCLIAMQQCYCFPAAGSRAAGTAVTPSTHCVSTQSDQGASWRSKECPKGRYLAGSMPCYSESWEEGIALNSLLGSCKNKCT